MEVSVRWLGRFAILSREGLVTYTVELCPNMYIDMGSSCMNFVSGHQELDIRFQIRETWA